MVELRKPYMSKIEKYCFFVNEDYEFDFKAINFLESDDRDCCGFITHAPFPLGNGDPLFSIFGIVTLHHPRMSFQDVWNLSLRPSSH